MDIVYSARSHKGLVRENNEDNFFADGICLTPKFRSRPFSIDCTAVVPAVLAVCDGMGGSEDGEEASRIATELLGDFQNFIKTSPSERLGGVINDYVEKASYSVNSYSQKTGTTLALAVIIKNRIRCFNIGDSRIYSLNSGHFSRVTNDHTKGQRLVENGTVAQNDARTIKGGNSLTRCIGMGQSFEVESYSPIEPDCRLLICSDGLSDMVSDEVIEQLLKIAKNTCECADALLKTALENGGGDNVTLIVADVKRDTAFRRISDFFKKRR